MFEYLWIVNLFFIFFSAYVADDQFTKGNPRAGWFNVVASAINLTAVLFHFAQ